MLEFVARADDGAPTSNADPSDGGHECARLEALNRYDLLDTAAEPCFDRIAKLAAQLLHAPYALMALVDANRQWFKARYGLELDQAPRRIAFGNQVIHNSRPFVVADAKSDSRFCRHPMVTGYPFVRFYAGVPIRTSDGFNIGTLCVMDTEPRGCSDENRLALSNLAAIAMDQIELRRSARRFEGEAARRAESEIALRESETKFREIAACASDWFWETDANDRMVSVTVGDRADFDGVDPTDIVGKSRGEMRDPTLPMYDILALQEAVARREPFRRMTVAIRYPTGKSFIVRTSGVPVFGADGTFTGYRGAASDVTRLARRDDELRQMASRNRLLATALDASASAVAVWDYIQSDRPIIYVNPAFTKLTGYAPDEIIGHSVRDLKGEHATEADLDAMQVAIANQRVHEFELRSRRKDGSAYSADIVLAPVFGQSDECIAYVSMFRDVTDERLAEARNRENQKLVALGELAGGVAHEINNLLQPSMMLTDVVATRLAPDDKESREDLDTIKDSSIKARDIVKSILLFSRKEQQVAKPLDFSVETHASLALVRGLLPAGISIVERISTEPCIVMSNRTELTQILTNLVLNAAQAMDNRGTVTVSLDQSGLSRSAAQAQGLEPGRYAVLSVTDTGSGIDPSVIGRIFEPFFTTKPVGQGTGLGLSVAYGIVRSWKGAIAAASAPGVGTTFTIYLPLICS